MSPKSSAEPPIGAQLGPCLPPGPHVLHFHHVHRPGWAPAKPSLTGEGQAGAVPGSAEALGQEQQSRSQESWGIKLRASGDSGIRLLSPAWRGGAGQPQSCHPLGDTTPPEPAHPGTTFEEEPGPPNSGPSCPLYQPGFTAWSPSPPAPTEP